MFRQNDLSKVIQLGNERERRVCEGLSQYMFLGWMEGWMGAYVYMN